MRELCLRRAAFGAAIVACVLVLSAAIHAGSTPEKLTDAEFWKLSTDMSEPGGDFRSDNLTSNEMGFQTIIPDLQRLTTKGVYMGVGPEQNFTYIAGLEPKMAFITDIRRGNLHLHLMYKAIFEMSKDRADFLGLLFSKPRPASVTATTGVNELFAAYNAASRSEALHAEQWAQIVGHLTKNPHTLPLDAADLEGIQWVYDMFFQWGSSINYNASLRGGGGFGGRGGSMANLEQLMTTNDGAGTQRSFLASEALFGVVKSLETRNLIVPVVGNFAGPKALRAVGSYIRAQGESVQAFYLSNVEDYLGGGLWETFCNSVASLPTTEKSLFIFGARGGGGGGRGFGGGLASMYRSMQADVKQYNCKAH